MKKLNVHLQYPWKFPDSPYYKYLIDSPPEGIEYLNVEKEKGVITNSSKFKFSQKIKDLIKNTPQRLGITIVNAHKTKSKENYDLIHCAHCLSKNNSPWVADLEMGGSLLISGFKNKNWQKKIRPYLVSDNCKKIMPWTNFVKKRILEDFPEIEDKMEVVYPAIPPVKKIKKKDKRLRIVYVARHFNLKGGIIALEVLKRLNLKHGIKGIVVSSVPTELKKEYSKFVEIHNLIPQKKLFEIMKNSEIFLYPSQTDTFGFAILESMSFGSVPIALKTPTTDSIEEIITNGKTGFLIKYSNSKGFIKKLTKEEEPLLKEITEKCGLLINDKKLREKISKNCMKEIESGKFSIKERNKKLRRIYEEALK